MYKGIYIALSGALLKQAQLEVITQNIANANTMGYKKDGLSFKDYLMPQDVAGAKPDGRVMSVLSEFRTDYANGVTVKTGNQLDLAVEGNGFIALEGDRYTRRGDLRKDRDGYLTTQDGVKVEGAGGPISIPADALSIEIDVDGKVSVVQPGNATPTELDTIKIVDFGPGASIVKAGNNQFTATGTIETTTSKVAQGHLETSNVDAIKEMVRMIESMREFESYQKVIQAFDETTAKVTDELGRM